MGGRAYQGFHELI